MEYILCLLLSPGGSRISESIRTDMPFLTGEGSSCLPSQPDGILDWKGKHDMTATTPSAAEGAAGAKATPVSDAAWECLQGAYDLQVHVAPDVIERRVDDLDLAKEFLGRGLKGFVLKSHYFPTAERAKVVTKAVPGIAAYGAITLNHSVGGLNPVALELAGRSGCKIVWFPTVDAKNETAGRVDGPSTKLPFWAKIQRELAATGISPPPLTVVDESGALVEAARRCLERIKKHDMILATGHLG